MGFTTKSIIAILVSPYAKCMVNLVLKRATLGIPAHFTEYTEHSVSLQKRLQQKRKSLKSMTHLFNLGLNGNYMIYMFLLPAMSLKSPINSTNKPWLTRLQENDSFIHIVNKAVIAPLTFKNVQSTTLDIFLKRFKLITVLNLLIPWIINVRILLLYSVSK